MHKGPNPDHKAADVQFNLATFWQRKGKLEYAITRYREVVLLRPDFIPAYLELCNLMLHMGKIDEAIALYRDAIALNPKEPVLQKNLDLLLKKIGKRNEENCEPIRAATPPLQKANAGANHILFYADCPGIHGAEQINHLVMCDLASSGYTITCVQAKASHHLIDERQRLGIYHVWIEDDNIYDETKAPRALTVKKEAHAIFSISSPDLIFFADGCPLSNLTAKEAAANLGIPFVVLVHCVYEDWAKQFASHLHRLPLMYGSAKEVVAVSHDNLHILHTRFGLPQEKGRVIYNGRPLLFFNPVDQSVRLRVRHELGIPAHALVSLTIGRIEPVKGYQY